MRNVIIYTKKFDLKFDDNDIALVDISGVIEELTKEFDLLDPYPTITVSDNVQYVSFKVSKKENRKKIGF